MTSSEHRHRTVVLSSAAALVALAWLDLVHIGRQMSASMSGDKAMAAMGMAATPWTPTDLALAGIMWSVMMVGMMVPSATPMLLVISRSHAVREKRFPIDALVFGAGYFVVWTGFSLAAAAAQWALHDTALLSPMMTTASPWLSGGILIVAGVYQLTPFKSACLIHCRNPIDFLMGHFRTGLVGAFRMGLHHGVHCLGCCWALMAVLFVVGVMNLVWVAAIAVFVLVEKTGWGGLWIPRLAGAGLIGGGFLMLIHTR